MIKDYMTEAHLGNFLTTATQYPIIRNRKVVDSGIMNRPDYLIEDIKVIVEFDGYLHYQSTKVILADQLKDDVYTEMGYEVIRLPYFIQLTEDVVTHLFSSLGENVKAYNDFPHGFVDKTALLPADFCSLGVLRFEKDMEKFHYLKHQIYETLEERANLLGDRRRVFPVGR